MIWGLAGAMIAELKRVSGLEESGIEDPRDRSEVRSDGWIRWPTSEVAAHLRVGVGILPVVLGLARR